MAPEPRALLRPGGSRAHAPLAALHAAQAGAAAAAWHVRALGKHDPRQARHDLNDLQAIERRLMRSITVMSSSYTPGRPRSDGH